MQNNKKMVPPPPSRTLASDLAEEFDDINFFPGTSPTTTANAQNNLKPPRLVKKTNSSSNSSSSIVSLTSGTSGNSSGSLANSNGFSDDFTLGSRTSNGNLNTVSRTHSHSHSHSHYHSQSRRPSHPSNSHNHRSKERFVFSNFRFLIKETCHFPDSVDEPFDWLSIEMVLVSEIENVLCPICLDVPCVPRFTRCGHIYCLPCLLQFFQTSEASSIGNNWRSCPVCAEPLHLKQLRPVKFCPATEPQEGEIFHSLLIQKAVGSLRPHRPIFSNDSLSSLSPFQRLIPISSNFVLNEIITPDINLLRGEIKNRKFFGEESLEMSFFEAAIKLLEDQKKQLAETIDSKEGVNRRQHEEPSNTRKQQDSYYFHQSRDGLNVFLHPLSMKILKHNFESYDAIPRDLSLPIIQLERVLVNSSNRKRFKYLDHLSLGTQIILVEVDLRSIVSDSILAFHSKELLNRQDARDQKLAKTSSVKSSSRDRSILEEWKMMEDDYYSCNTQAMDIRVPESVKLDNLDDDASFPLPSSFNSPLAIPIKTNLKKSPPTIGSTVGSPSFSALAHSLNSPFTFSSSINFSNEALFPESSTLHPSSSSSPPTQTPSWVTSPPSTTSTDPPTNGKKKIVLFSSGLNVKQR